MTEREPLQTPIFRAPMRARLLDAPEGAGAEHGVEHGVVGTGDALAASPATLDEAVAAVTAAHLGRIAGPWRYSESAAAREVGIHDVRPADWLALRFGPDEVPPAVAATFARGGRNLQRTHGPAAERRTAELWAAHR